jgi:hypothetical protein
MKRKSISLILLAASAMCLHAATITEYFEAVTTDSPSYGFPAPGPGFYNLQLGETIIGSFSFDPALASPGPIWEANAAVLPITVTMQDAHGSVYLDSDGAYVGYAPVSIRADNESTHRDRIPQSFLSRGYDNNEPTLRLSMGSATGSELDHQHD